MKLWQTFDVRKYIQDKSLCDLLEEQDTFETKLFVDKFFDFVKLDTIHPNAKTAIIAPSGNGKSFFLGLLYCKLHAKEKTVHFVDILDYIGNDAQMCIDKIAKYADKECGTVNILIDNLDKHSSEFIYSFIYLLHRLSIQENFFFVMAFDYAIVEGKLAQLTHTNNEIEHFLQSYIDIEFYLGGKIPIRFLHDIIDNEFKGDLESYVLDNLKYFISRFIDIKNISVKQLNNTINKLKILINRHDDYYNDIDTVCLFNLIMLKMIDKKTYQNLLMGELTDSEIKEILLDDILNSEYVAYAHLAGTTNSLINHYTKIIQRIELVYI